MNEVVISVNPHPLDRPRAPCGIKATATHTLFHVMLWTNAVMQRSYRPGEQAKAETQPKAYSAGMAYQTSVRPPLRCTASNSFQRNQR